MADLAGGIVGAVSLGIQICKELVDYIDSAKNAAERKLQISEQVDTLTGLLELLDSEVAKLKDGDCKTATMAGVLSCSDALDSIRAKLALLSKGCANGSKFRQQMGALRQRLLFPFKEGDLLHCKGVVESVQHNLNTALLILQVEQRRVDAERVKLQIERQSRLFQETSLTIVEAQQYQHDQISHQLLKHTQVMTSGVGQVSDRLSRLEAKLGQLTPQSFSVNGIEDGYADLSDVGQSIKKIRRRVPKKMTAYMSCGCHEQSTSTVYLQWPFRLERTITTLHKSSCRYSAFEEAVTNMNIRFSICSLVLRKKAQVAIALSCGAGLLSLSPDLKSYRVVDRRSPAFKLIASFKRSLGPRSRPDAWKKPSRILYKLFQTKVASPHDRLPDGKTLLHYFCDMGYKYLNQSTSTENIYAMAKCLLDYMPREALEKDDDGFTCIDHCLWAGYVQLIQDLTNHGIPISIGRHVLNIQWNLAWEGMDLHKLDEDLLDCSDRMKAVLLKSEERLKAVLNDEEYASNSDEDGYSLYEMATLVGWRRGCDMIFERGIKIEVVHSLSSLLAMACRHPDVLAFWLETRTQLGDPVSLQVIGNLEEVFDSGHGNSTARQAILSAMADQRRQLQSLAETHLSADQYSCHNGSLLDAQAWDFFNALVEKSIPVKLSLRPSRPCVYHRFTSGPGALQLLYEAGFRDINAVPALSTIQTSVPPLMNLLTFNETESRGYLFDTVEWFLSKGASLEECWPNSDLTLFHLLGWKRGNVWSNNIPRGIDRPPLKYITDTTPADTCHCACSSSGCFFITMVCKGLTTPFGCMLDGAPNECSEEMWQSIYVTWEARLATLAHWIAPAILKSENRWLVTEFIRLVTFWKLGLRHTCCDPKRIEHSKHHSPDFDASPYRDFANPQDIGDEDVELDPKHDAYLVELLEDLVLELDTEFTETVHEHYCDIEEFFYFTLIPRLDLDVQRLRKEDLIQFSQGRSELGIVMEIETSESEEDDDDNEEDDSGNDDDEESDYDIDEDI